MPRRRELFALPAMFAGMVTAVSGATLPNTTRGPKEAKRTVEPFGEILVFYEGSTDQIGSMTAGSLRLKAGMSPHPPHEHAEEEFIVITEGTGEILIDGKKQQVGPGSVMYCGANKAHGITNTGKSPLLFYYFKWKV